MTSSPARLRANLRARPGVGLQVPAGLRRLLVLRDALDPEQFFRREALVDPVQRVERDDREPVDGRTHRAGQPQQAAGPLDVLLPLGGRGLRALPEHVVEVGEEVLVVGVVQRVGGPVEEAVLDRRPVELAEHLQALPPQGGVLRGVRPGELELRRGHPAEPAADRAALGQLDGGRRVHDLLGPLPAELPDTAVDHPVPPCFQPGVGGDDIGPQPGPVVDLLLHEHPVAQHRGRHLGGAAGPDQAGGLGGEFGVDEREYVGRGELHAQGCQRRLRVTGEGLLVLRIHGPSLQEALHVRDVADVVRRHIRQVAQQCVIRR